jgi:hypothetical protein
MVVEWRFARSITFIPVSEGVVLRERAQRFQKCAQYQPHMSILHISKSITLPQAYTKPLYEHFNKKITTTMERDMEKDASLDGVCLG